MYADAPPIALFSFSVYDASGVIVGPVWERFVRCQMDGSTDWDALFEVVEIILDYAGIEEFDRVKIRDWDVYTTHILHDWRGKPVMIKGRRDPEVGARGAQNTLP